MGVRAPPSFAGRLVTSGIQRTTAQKQYLDASEMIWT